MFIISLVSINLKSLGVRTSAGNPIVYGAEPMVTSPPALDDPFLPLWK